MNARFARLIDLHPTCKIYLVAVAEQSRHYYGPDLDAGRAIVILEVKVAAEDGADSLVGKVDPRLDRIFGIGDKGDEP